MSSYQLPSISCGLPCFSELRRSCEGSFGPGSVRQHYGGCVHLSSRWYSFPVSVSSHSQSLGLVSLVRFTSRLPFFRERTTFWPTSSPEADSFRRNRYSNIFSVLERFSGSLSSSGVRPFCLFSDLSASQVLLPFQGSSSLESRRNVLPFVRPALLCFSPVLHDSQVSGEGCSGRSRVSFIKRLFSRGDRGSLSAVSSCGDSVGAFVSARSYHSAPLLAQSSRVPR